MKFGRTRWTTLSWKESAVEAERLGRSGEDVRKACMNVAKWSALPRESLFGMQLLGEGTILGEERNLMSS